ncbi:hypothetical protein BHE90_009708 [Fusarium euwallaceae]|uniref:Thioredoxin domain-containing protein n=2 Tax=Fusarium solani species complex TaxID=232080 RepID=A0A430LJF6_9HYPO|nr:hypothetical protein CEP51_016516 [Fusarium floridanum]RTE75837.1 hypothetical protein BHE90_009708 [Fusarium euwallaceae]
MSVIELKSREQFNELINKTPYVAIQAQASWCGPCKAISPFFTKHADAHAIPDKYAFAKFDTDDVPDLAFELGIRSIPAFFFFKNGDKDNDLIGPIPPKLKVLVEGYSAEAKGEAPAAEKPAEKPAEPAAEKPAEEKPAEEKPAEKPAEEKPAEEKPAEEKKEENTLKTDENF